MQGTQNKKVAKLIASEITEDDITHDPFTKRKDTKDMSAFFKHKDLQSQMVFVVDDFVIEKYGIPSESYCKEYNSKKDSFEIFLDPKQKSCTELENLEVFDSYIKNNSAEIIRQLSACNDGKKVKPEFCPLVKEKANDDHTIRLKFNTSETNSSVIDYITSDGSHAIGVAQKDDEGNVTVDGVDIAALIPWKSKVKIMFHIEKMYGPSGGKKIYVTCKVVRLKVVEKPEAFRSQFSTSENLFEDENVLTYDTFKKTDFVLSEFKQGKGNMSSSKTSFISYKLPDSDKTDNCIIKTGEFTLERFGYPKQNEHNYARDHINVYLDPEQDELADLQKFVEKIDKTMDKHVKKHNERGEYISLIKEIEDKEKKTKSKTLKMKLGKNMDGGFNVLIKSKSGDIYPVGSESDIEKAIKIRSKVQVVFKVDKIWTSDKNPKYYPSIRILQMIIEHPQGYQKYSEQRFSDDDEDAVPQQPKASGSKTSGSKTSGSKLIDTDESQEDDKPKANIKDRDGSDSESDSSEEDDDENSGSIIEDDD